MLCLTGQPRLRLGKLRLQSLHLGGKLSLYLRRFRLPALRLGREQRLCFGCFCFQSLHLGGELGLRLR